MIRNFAVTATRSMKSYASKAADELSRFPSFSTLDDPIDCVDALSVDRFADGEMEVSINHSLRGRDIFLFASCARNEATIDALIRSQAAKITVFEPYVSCSRSDRPIRRSSVGLWVHLKTMVSLGTTHFLTYQLHSDKSKSMLDPTLCHLDDLPALTLLKKRICDVYIRDVETLKNQVRPNWAFCSVDAGGEKLGRRFANAFGASLVVAHKQRDYTKVNSIESVNILSAEPITGKVVWIVDDMIDTAGSVVSLIRALASHNPAEINLAAVHAVFSDPAAERLTELANEGLLNHILVTDTVFCPHCGNLSIPNLEIVPSVELSAKIIAAIVENRPMGKILQEFDAETYLKSRGLFA